MSKEGGGSHLQPQIAADCGLPQLKRQRVEVWSKERQEERGTIPEEAGGLW